MAEVSRALEPVNMDWIDQQPELKAFRGDGDLIRIPNQLDVPVTARVRRMIDTAAFQRLSQVSQLGLVRFVYPGAIHNRFEHSLGVYRNALLFLNQFAIRPRFLERVTSRDIDCLILAALLHDIGHWPFCHPIEDLQLEGVPNHEQYAARFVRDAEIEKLLVEDWEVTSDELLGVINGDPQDQRDPRVSISPIIRSILSGPIDIDKMDYLYRDSLHAGVPYGQNFDAQRLVRSLCLDRAGKRVAISRKGKTAAELMVFARYVMFSEVYWHHAVRSATAMFQRAFYLWHQDRVASGNLEIELDRLFQLSDAGLTAAMLKSSENRPAGELLHFLFGSRRSLFKRVVSFGMQDRESLYTQLSQRPYPWLVACSRQLAAICTDVLAVPISPDELLIDAPPVGLEVQFNVDVHDPATDSYCRLEEVSPVVKTLAQRQFDDFVKQVRIFVAPHLQTAFGQPGFKLDAAVQQAIDQVGIEREPG